MVAEILVEDTDTSPYYTSAPPYMDEGLHVRFKALKNFKLTVKLSNGYDGNVFDRQGLHYNGVDVIAGNTYDKCFASHEPESPRGSSKGIATFTLLADGVPFYISSKPYNYGLSWDN